MSRAYASLFLLLVFRPPPKPFSSRLPRPAKPSYRVSPARIQSLPLSSLFAILCNEFLTSYLRLLKISPSLVEDRCILVFTKMGTYDKKISGRIAVAEKRKRKRKGKKKKGERRSLRRNLSRRCPTFKCPTILYFLLIPYLTRRQVRYKIYRRAH